MPLPGPCTAVGGLYGSVARRESDDASDIDLIVVVDALSTAHAPEWTDQTDELTRRVRTWTGNRLELIVVDAHHLAGLAIAGDPLTLSLREATRPPAALLRQVPVVRSRRPSLDSYLAFGRALPSAR